MFGVVPRSMWSKLNPPDEQNLCTWAMRTLLVQTADRNILIDTGIGNKQDDKFRTHFKPEGEHEMLDSLRREGMSPGDITDVFLTHLHFDHCGGALRKHASGEIEPTFPNATYWSNERHFQWAMQPNDREKASFLKENFVPLLEQKRLRFLPVRQNTEFLPGFRVRFYYGHTEAMMAPLLKTESGPELLYCADAMPSRWHIGMPYVMAYDVRPLQTMKEKAQILHDAVTKKQILFFEHDPEMDCGTVRMEANGRIVLDRTGTLEDFLKS